MSKLPIIFLAFANDFEEGSKKYLRNLPQEKAELREILEKAENDGLCEVVIRSNATLKEIIREFQKREYKDRIAIFHYSGHANSYSLVFEDEFRRRDIVHARGFTDFLQQQKNLQLVFLNACVTEKQARSLLKANVPAVISTQAYVQDNIARKLAVYFYGFLAKGDGFLDAYNQAVALVGSQHEPTNVRSLYHPKRAQNRVPWQIGFSEKTDVRQWNLPEVSDNPLYNLPKPKNNSLPSVPYPGLRPYDDDYASVFWGRDSEIRVFYNVLTHSKSNSQLFLLYGGSGTGKTSFVRAGIIPRMEMDFSVYYHNGAEPFESLNEILLKLETPINKRIYLFIDDLNLPNEAILRLIQTAPKAIYFVLIIRHFHFNAWQENLQAMHLSFQSYFLPRLTKKGIKQIIEGPTLKDVKVFYNIEMEPGLSERLSFLFHDDLASSIAPYLQYLMVYMWKQAKEKPTMFSWDLYQELKSNQLWSDFLDQQIEKASSIGYENGFSLNLIDDILSLESNATLEVLEKRYLHSNLSIPNLLHELKEKFVIGEVFNQRKSHYYIIGHHLLTYPFSSIINQSDRVAQKTKRWLQYYSNSASDASLSREQLETVRDTLVMLPPLTESEENLIALSEKKVQREKNRGFAINFLRFFTILLVLGFSFFISSPYMLLFLILILVLYDA